MADKKISALTASTTPLAGTEVLPIVQSGTTKQVSVANLTAGRTVGATNVLLDASGTLYGANTSGSFYSAITPYDGAGGMTFLTGYSVGAMTFVTGGSTSAVLASTGDLTLSKGNLVIGTAGKGIDFSATTSGSGTMTSELLSDYEEGTWTPGISFGGASVGVTYVSTLGYYTKVGNVVTVSCYINMSNKGSSTGSARITALPFTCNSNSAAYAAPALFFTNMTFSGQVAGYVNISDTTIDLINISILGAAPALTDANFANNTSFIVNLTYRTA